MSTVAKLPPRIVRSASLYIRILFIYRYSAAAELTQHNLSISSACIVVLNAVGCEICFRNYFVRC